MIFVGGESDDEMDVTACVNSRSLYFLDALR